nr:hypothetical protein OG781_01405 [Streptomyces sp. NBC_00830]WTB35674.1 hypothetical protein OG781_45175 [Streptomyces sp. NBC_00830]
MLHGGLRPGEVLGLHLDDLAYGRRRVVVRHRDDHPKGVRSKSRVERVVDLHEAATLATVSAYVMNERPDDGRGTAALGEAAGAGGQGPDAGAHPDGDRGPYRVLGGMVATLRPALGQRPET